MQKLQRIVLVVMLLFGTNACDSKKSAETERADEVDDSVAEHALQQIANLAANGLYEKLGFKDAEEAARAELGPALPVYFIGLQAMRNYTPDIGMSDFLGEPVELVYPVNVDDRVRSSIGIQKNGNGWQIASMGRPNLARSLEQLQRLHNSSGGHSTGSEYFVVEIPSLYLIFLGHRDAVQVNLTPNADDDDLGFSRGKAMDGATILGRVKELALVSDGALNADKR